MSTLTKVALGFIGKLHPVPAAGENLPLIALPAPAISGGMPLLDALRNRRSSRAFLPKELPLQLLSNLLWCGFGINREEEGRRTAPTAGNVQEIDVYAAMSSGLYRYEPHSHVLQRVGTQDVRRVTGYQDFVDDAPVDLIYVADYTRMRLVPAAQRKSYVSVAVGAIAENIYLYCASAGLATVIRAWIDRHALTNAMSLTVDHEVLLSQTVGYPGKSGDEQSLPLAAIAS